MRKVRWSLSLVLLGAVALWSAASLAAENRGVEHGQRYDRLVIRNVIVIDGKGTPPRGPMDVILENGRIAAVRGPAPGGPAAYAKEAHLLDGTGMYLLPGFINNHVHLQDSRGGISQPFEYSYKLWLGCGITTVRDVGSDIRKTVEERKKSAEGTIIAPRIYLYMTASGTSPAAIRLRVQELKKAGADGIKLFGLDRDLLKAADEEAARLGLRVSRHVGVEETDAWDDAAFGSSTIEHWYGIPDAALNGSQNFPPSYNYSNEVDRFRYAGRLWREADPEKLKKVLQALVDKGVGWVPTFAIY
jgi:Amidohydrolase family